MPQETYKAFYDRKIDTIEGVFTIQDDKEVKLFARLPARSGQRWYTTTSWARGKSPIPYSSQVRGETLYLHTKAISPGYLFPAQPGGIGRFYPISSSPIDTLNTRGANHGKLRMALGLHPDNDWIHKAVNKDRSWLHVGSGWQGSAGCVALAVGTALERENCQKVFAFLDSLHADGVPWIELMVL